ncbi:PH domain-containing protein [Aliiglaciecola lipolytica]|uniref:YdbS-like PH domain-containing protein n=1 Tax=Aliiglaciecola lipolytica E3 TaxID=1127673 RepID=K6XMN2_9ALTE|nr:PH domain-containing protein [Aliiglaciecola lipolytica]GAC12931.1 hypothetical protein GLIP_0281 [Aliiglaciecola lipolytica E3]
MDKDLLAPEASNNHWQRLSPIAVLYFVASGIKTAANNAIYLLPALAVSYSTAKESPQLWIPIVIAVLCLISLTSFLQYAFYSFRLANENIEIRSGVFSKTYINLPFTRIQNVTIERPLYYRFTNTCCLQLDTAGSAKQEAKIVALPVDYAERLKHSILLKEKPATSKSATDCASESLAQNAQAEYVLNTRSIKDLVIHGITNNRVWIIIGAMAPFYDDVARSLAGFAERAGIDYQHYFDSQSQAFWQVGLAIISLIFVAMLSVTLLSVIGSIVLFYDYSLAKTDDRYIRRSGLFTKQEVTIKRSRLQVIAQKQDWLDVILGRINLELKQNSSGIQQTNELQDNQNKILVPSVTHSEADIIIRDAFSDNNLGKISFNAISPRFILRQCLWLIPLNLLFSLMAYFKSGLMGILLIQIICSFIICLIYIRWKRWGYASDNEYIYIRKGLFGVDHYCFPKFKVQQTQFIQSRMMLKQGLASINVIMASGALRIPFMRQHDAKSILENVLFTVSFKRKSWM